jgi:acyl-CoA synthetase (AMP-forming)/AMP-acid ligase II
VSTTGERTFNLADLFEQAVDAYPEREYLVVGDQRRTYAQMEERANRLAHDLAEHGVEPGDHVGIYAHNSAEWVETLWAVFKIRATWININYRYVEGELSYLFGNSDLKALVYEQGFGPRVAACVDALAQLVHALVIDDGSGAGVGLPDAVPYEDALAAASPERDFGPRSPNDRYILYTGGTTGMPKGVVWRHEDVFMALGGGIDPMTKVRATKPEEIIAKAYPDPITFFPIAPLMHGATQWGLMSQAMTGNRVVLVANFDADECWELIQREGINSMMITGDAMARPLIETLQANRDRYDVSSLFSLSSSAAVFSPSVKDQFFEVFPDLILTDAIGASESGNNGMVVVGKGNTAMKGGPTVTAMPDSVVIDEDFNIVQPGSGVVGKVARFGNIPLGYYNDEVKTAETFITGPDGTRYAVPGDFATVEEDGSITLLGRGSVSINSGGEKIYPEEVEAAVKSHPAIYDATVIGVNDERWGQRVAAVVQLRDGAELASVKDLQEHCRKEIAGYKVPRQVHFVDAVTRAPSGKPDYRWAAEIAAGNPELIDEDFA